MLANDGSGSVTREVSNAGVREISYTAYGYTKPADSDVGYNGEVRDALTECYLLGNGYRAFSPALMRFCRYDSWSPFRTGGINGYAYVGNNPLTNTDPSGHMVKPTSFIRQALAEAAEEMAARAGRTSTTISTPASSKSTQAIKATGDSTEITSEGASVGLGAKPASKTPTPVPAKPVKKASPDPMPGPSNLARSGEAVGQRAKSTKKVTFAPELEVSALEQLPARTRSKTVTQPPAKASKSRPAPPKMTAEEKVNAIREKGKYQWDQ